MNGRRLRLLMIPSGIIGALVWGCAAGADAPPSEPRASEEHDASESPAIAVDASDARSEGDGSCSDDGWCLVEPPWNGDLTLVSLWGSSKNDVWAVGSRGAIFHWDGSAWQRSDTGVDRVIRRVWGSGPGDVWAFSTLDEVLHCSGWVDGQASWSPVRFAMREDSLLLFADQLTTPVVSVWGAGANDIYIGTLQIPGGSSVWHMNGLNDGKTNWQPILEYKDFHGPVFGTSATDVWAAGLNGKVASSQGYKDGIIDWTLLDSGTRANLRGLWGSAHDDVWVVGDVGTIRHFTYDDDGVLRWLPSESNVTRSLTAVWGSRPDDVWAVGEGRTVLHGDGEHWTPSTLPAGISAETRLFDVWGTSPDDVWIVGDNVILERRGPSEVPQ